MSAAPAPRLIDELREYRKLKYMGDCKCGQCQLVPLDLIYRVIAALRRPAPPGLEEAVEAARRIVAAKGARYAGSQSDGTKCARALLALTRGDGRELGVATPKTAQHRGCSDAGEDTK